MDIAVRVCTRCGGTGKHSYNLRHGDMCYGCGGTGKVVVTPKGQSGKATADKRNAVVGDIILEGRVLYRVERITWCKINDFGNQKIKAVRLVDGKAFAIYRAAIHESGFWVNPTPDMIGTDV